MVNCLTFCNTSCITCIWCLLLSLCFPKLFNNFDDTDSCNCTFKPIPKPKSCQQSCKRSYKVKECKLRRRPRSSTNCSIKPNDDSRDRIRCKYSEEELKWDGNIRKLAACDSRHSNNCEVQTNKFK